MPEDQHQNEDEEGEHVLVVAAEEAAGEVADVAGAERLDQSQQHAAEHGAGQVADAAEHRRGERLQAEDEAHVVVGDRIVGANHYAGHRRQRRADEEGRRDDDVDVDAHQSGDLRIFRRGAHRAA